MPDHADRLVAAGGCFRLVIVSERRYGNTLIDTDPSTRRKQLWVSAIDASPVAGQDPSHQAFWSLIGEACTTAADCRDPIALCTGGFCSEKAPQ